MLVPSTSFETFNGARLHSLGFELQVGLCALCFRPVNVSANVCVSFVFSREATISSMVPSLGSMCGAERHRTCIESRCRGWDAEGKTK